MDSGGGLSAFATELQFRAAKSCRRADRICAGGVGEPVLLAPRPDWEAKAHEGGEERGPPVEPDEWWSVSVAHREGDIRSGAEALDLNRPRGRIDCRSPDCEAADGCD